MSDRVLILGASARAAAASARRAGLTPFAVDLFADRDTRLLCEHVERCPFADYPRGLFDAARRMPPMPWLYTGGLENFPDLVGELAAERELWGNGPDVLRRVRDPFALSRLLSAKGHWHPEVRPATSPPPADGRWLRKPLRGSGGLGVRVARPDDPPSADHYYQRFISGDPYSLAVGAGPVGHTRQLVGTTWLHTDGFQYAGSVGPVPGDHALAGYHLTIYGDMRGLFGVDFIDAEGGGYTVEVNPRYTASVEVHEYATATALLRRTNPPPPAARVVGKAVYYAARQLTVPPSGPWDESLARCADVWRRPDFADIPQSGEVIEPGQPVITLLADGATEAAVLATLKARAAELDRLFGVPTPEDHSP